MSLHSSLPNRVRFMLQEVIELRTVVAPATRAMHRTRSSDHTLRTIGRGQWKERKADPTLRAASASVAVPAAPPAGPPRGGSDRILPGHGDVRNEVMGRGSSGSALSAYSGASGDDFGGASGVVASGGCTLPGEGQQQNASSRTSGGPPRAAGGAPCGRLGSKQDCGMAREAATVQVTLPPLTEAQLSRKLEDILEDFNEVWCMEYSCTMCGALSQCHSVAPAATQLSRRLPSQPRWVTPPS